MALTKEEDRVRVEVVGPYRNIQVATDTVVKEDGVEISRSRHRRAIACDHDISGEDAEIKAIADIVWTQEVKDAHAAAKAAHLAKYES